MAQEKLLSDYSGGMNALTGVDKQDPKECLLAENVRLDETGSIQSAGAFTHQNTSAYVDAIGNKNIHSLYWNPTLGGIAGIGQDVFQGGQLAKLKSGLTAANTAQQKMSFASAPNRVYFDVGNVGYWSDMKNLLTVDWAPPSATSAVATGPNTGTLTNSTSTNYGFSLGAQAMQGIQATVVETRTTTVFAGYDSGDGIHIIPTTATFSESASLFVGGAVVGTSTSIVTRLTNRTLNDVTVVSTLTRTWGNANTLWGFAALTPTQVNASNFGIVYTNSESSGGGSISATFSTPKITAYQVGAGFVAATGAAGTLTGTYSWKITFVAANGEESDGSVDSTNVILSAQQGTLTAIPTGDARTTSRNIYRKGYAVNTPLTLHYLVGSIPDNTTTVYSDNQTDIAAITAGVILAGDVPGDFANSRLGNIPVRFPSYHYDRVFWVNQTQPNQLIWSKPLNGFAYPAVNFLNVGDSSAISRTASIFGELIIIKTNGQIWRLTGTDESSFDLTQTPSSVGTDESFTVAILPDKLPFANRWGLWVFNGYTSQPLTNKLDLWFKQEDRTNKSLFGVNGFHPPEVTSPTVPLNFEAVGNSDKYVLAYAEAGQTQNNAILIFDLKHGNITKRQLGTPFPLSLSIDPVTGFVYMGDNQGFISLIDDWNGTNGGGAALNFDFQHGYQDFQRGSNKALWALEFYLNTNGQSLTPSVYYDNGSASETLPALSAAGLQRIVRTMEAATSRKMQNFSWRLNGSLSQVNASGTPQVEIVHVKALWDIRAGRARTGQ